MRGVGRGNATIAHMQLVRPAESHLGSYAEALRRGWSPDTGRDQARLDALAAIARSATSFLATLDDVAAQGPPVILPDGSVVPRLPGYQRWMWDGEFAGAIGLRWQRGTPDLPPHCLGHIGYSVVPWKRRQGYATEALRLTLPDAAAQGLPYVEIVTDIGNTASQRVVLANGGILVERFFKSREHHGGEACRFRIYL